VAVDVGFASWQKLEVFALIGREDQVLLRYDNGQYALPGGPVRGQQPIESSLCKMLRDQLGISSPHLNFYVAVECVASAGGALAYTVAMFFDASLTETDLSGPDTSLPHRWIGTDELASIDLQPHEARRALSHRLLVPESRWLPATTAWGPQ
jgi:ADP-ribose pyrophosphatase YjhB (NUDIX family)